MKAAEALFPIPPLFLGISKSEFCILIASASA
jgi:hypothetical protein